MKKTISIIFVALIAISLISGAPAKEVSNEEIRDAILSLVHSYNLLDNKLERHEHRERALGELVKRALQSLQKGQKAFEPMNGIFSRLDERVSQIETMLMTQEEKYNLQSDKLGEALEGMFKWMHENNECFNKRFENNKKPESVKPEINAAAIKAANAEQTEQIVKLSKNVNELVKTSKDLLNQTEKLLGTKLATADEVISKLEDKLSNLYITRPVTPSPEEIAKNNEFEEKISTYLEQISTNVKTLQQVPKVSEKLLTDLDRSFLQGISNETLNAIEDLKSDVLTASDKALTKTTLRLKESSDNIDKSVNDILRTVTDSADAADKFYTDVNSSYASLHEGLEVFNKFDKILLSTSDHILDTQRKVEFNTHLVLQKVGELMREENSLLNKTLQKRFNDIDNSILTNHLEALQNLSSTMESEISHVWRQIEIMHNEMTRSKDALNKLQDQTEAYVNGTFTTMDSMEGKVSQITGRMSEVDSNLNFLLGRLSLVTQEFNRIKSGLGNALDDIRNSFQTVQDKIKNVGPGPHNIPKDEYLTDINLLQRDAPAST